VTTCVLCMNCCRVSHAHARTQELEGVKLYAKRYDAARVAGTEAKAKAKAEKDVSALCVIAS
jgi:hypothetical protein